MTPPLKPVAYQTVATYVSRPMNPTAKVEFRTDLVRSEVPSRTFSGSAQQAIDAAHALVIKSPSARDAVGVFTSAHKGVFELNYLNEASPLELPVVPRRFGFSGDYPDFRQMPIGGPVGVRVERAPDVPTLIAVVGNTRIASFAHGKAGEIEQYRAHDPQPHWRVRTNDVSGNPVGY